jgi:ribose transport system substrate-binding protein
MRSICGGKQVRSSRLRSATLLSTFAVLAALCLPAFGSASAATTKPIPASGSSSAATTKPITVAFVTGEFTDPFFTAMHCGMIAGAKAAKVHLIWEGSPLADDTSVLQVLDAVMTEKPAGLMFEPFDSTGEVAPLQAVVKTGIPVVIVDGSLAKKVGIQNPHTDSFAAGKAAGALMASKITAGGVVGVVSDRPSNSVQDLRYRGFEAGLKAADPTVKFLPIQYAGTSTSDAATDVGAWIVANTDLRGVFASAGPLGSGAASAVDAAGMKGKILVYSYDTEPYEVSSLKQGEQQVLIGQSPYTEGYHSVVILSQVLRHQVNLKVPYEYYTPFKLITLHNVNTAAAKPFIYKSC